MKVLSCINMIGSEVIPIYSHKETCSDCTCVVTITNDCIASFEEIHNVQVLASKQLSVLVESRERINEVIEGVTPATSLTSTPNNNETPDGSNAGANASNGSLSLESKFASASDDVSKINHDIIDMDALSDSAAEKSVVSNSMSTVEGNEKNESVVNTSVEDSENTAGNEQD